MTSNVNLIFKLDILSFQNRATLVEDFNTFWVGVDSDIIIDLTADQLATVSKTNWVVAPSEHECTTVHDDMLY